MPEGPIFSDAPVGSPVSPCRTGKTTAASWDMPCLLKILCGKDKSVIDHVRNNIDLYKVDKVYFEDPYFDGTKWTTKHFEAGGTSGGGEITFLSSDSCESAATTLFHETWHSKQPAGMGWPHPAEDDAYYNAELWTIDRGLPGQAGPRLRTKDATGKTVPDKAEIKKYVDEAYPVQKTAPPEWKISDIDTKTNKTHWKNTKTGADIWKSSVKGDTMPGPQITKGKTKIPETSVKCP
jgi:hypothetical protein